MTLRDSIIHLTLSICSAGNQTQWRIQGRGPGHPGEPPLFLDQTERAGSPPSPLSQELGSISLPHQIKKNLHLADHFPGIIILFKNFHPEERI